MNQNKQNSRSKRNSQSRKGANSRSKGKGREENFDEKIEDQRSGKGAPIINNAAMYFKDKQLAEMVTNFSFNQYLGSERFDESYPELSVPNVLQIYLNPSPGWLDGNVSEGINAIALKMYTLLSANNAKTTTYGPQDLSTLVLAMGQLIAMSEHCRRILGCAYLYSIRNRFIPRGLIDALGVDSSDLFNSLAQYRIKFNTILNRMNAIPMVSNIEYFKKSYEIYRHVYTDTESPMCQYYVTIPRSTWIVDEASYSGGTILKTVSVTSRGVPKTFDQLLGILDNMLAALMQSSTFNAIYSDILRLNKADWTFELCSEGYTCMPEFNPMIQLQFMNATIMGEPVADPTSMASTLAGEYPFGDYTPGNDVYPVIGEDPQSQSANSLRFNPLFTFTSDIMSKSRLINFPDSTGNPDLDQRCDATRYVAILKNSQQAYDGELWYNGDQSTDSIVNSIVLPDYYVTFMRAVTYIGNTSAHAYNLPIGNVFKFRDSYETAGMFTEITTMTVLSNFEYAPLMYLDLSPSSGTEYEVHILNSIGELDFFTFVDYDRVRM